MKPWRVGSAIAGALVMVVVSAGAWASDSTQPNGPASVPVKSYGPDFSLPKRQVQAGDPNGVPSVTEYDLSMGCIVGGLSGTGLSVGAGGINVVNLIAGGLVPAASPVAAYLAIGGVVFASFCAVGQALTPAALATYDYFVPPEPYRSPRQLEARYCTMTTASLKH